MTLLLLLLLLLPLCTLTYDKVHFSISPVETIEAGALPAVDTGPLEKSPIPNDYGFRQL
jgi:hypothetical protein